MTNSREYPTVAATKDMDCLFVLADEYASESSAATSALIAQAAVEWNCELDPARLPAPVRLWYKTTEEGLKPCSAKDPDADSQWWAFSGIHAHGAHLPERD